VRFIVAALLWMALSSPLLALSFAPRPLHDLSLPDMSFTNASVAEVAGRLSEVYKSEYVRLNRREFPSEIRFQIHPSCSNVVVNIDIGHCSLYSALDTLCSFFGLEYVDYDNFFTVAQRHALPLSHRMYDIIPSAFTVDSLKENDAAPFFMQLGVDFPEGASATYLPRVSKLIVCNTITNLKLFEKCLSILNFIPYQVEATVQLLQFTDVDVAHRLRQDSTSPTNKMALLSKARELVNLSAVSYSNQTTTNAISLVNVKAKNSSISKGAMQFIVHPVVSPEGDLIQAMIQISMALPINDDELFTYETSTSLMMYHGASMLIWITPPGGAAAEEQKLCLVVSSRLMGPDGKVVPVRDDRDKEIAERIIFH
jgi:hypothetical protein